MAVLLIQVQLLYDVKSFLDYWISEVTAKITQIQKILKYINDNPETKLLGGIQPQNQGNSLSQIQPSLISGGHSIDEAQAHSTYYATGFIVK